MEYKDEVQDKMKIITFGNSRYKRIAHNWALYLHQHNIDNYIIYSLDRDIYQYLINRDINTQLYENTMFTHCNFRSIDRMKIITQHLDSGINVLHSDLDAVWLKNPLNFITNDYDVIASTGTFPSPIYRRLGYTICMGWIYYKSCDIVTTLLRNTVDNHNCSSDQLAFNRELFNGSRYKNLKLKTLDQSIVSRGQPHNENTYVAHPVSKKNIDREKFLKSKNLWILDNNLLSP